MIKSIRRRFLTLRHNYTNPIDRQRAGILLVVNFAMIVVMVVYLALLILSGANGQPIEPRRLVIVVVFLGVTRFIHQFIQNGQLRIAIWTFVAIATTAVLQAIALGVGDYSLNISGGFVAAVVLPLVVAGVLLDRRGLLIVMVVTLVVVTFGALNQLQFENRASIIPAELAKTDFPIVVIAVILATTFLLAFTSNLERLANESLKDIKQRQWISEFSIELNRLADETDILTRGLTLIRDRFQYLFAQVYLVNEEGNLSYSVRTGLTQADNTGRGGLKISDPSIVSEAARLRQPTTTHDADNPGRRSQMLTAANYEVALPMVVNGVVLGVLDIQSGDTTPFSQNEVTVLLLIADHIGTALQNSRLISELQRGLRDQENSNNRLQTQIQEYRQREQRGVSELWGGYLKGRAAQAIGFDIFPDNPATPIPASDLPETITQTLQSGKMQVDNAGEEQIINVPITFRDQTLGAMSFAIPKNQTVTEKQLEMAEIVAQRLALALDNTRLFEQSQAQALRERKASEITSLLIGATDVNAVLEIAAANFNEALGAVHTHIYIQPDMLVEPLAHQEQSR